MPMVKQHEKGKNYTCVTLKLVLTLLNHMYD